jgi:1-deoxy-D-xylulose-5-phosphate reductoisomerase
MRSLTVLGSTGSIGVNALNVVRELPDYLAVRYLTAYKNSHLLIDQSLEFKPTAVAIVDEREAQKVKEALSGKGIEVLAGFGGILEIAGRDDVDLVLNAIVGSAGMQPTISALETGRTIALSNKESLVMAGQIIREIGKRNGAQIYPVDSEHSAIWQCLLGEDIHCVEKLILTGSGGPFRMRERNTFHNITVDEALKHPNWNMGSKITIDSATMMNKM